MTQSTDDLLAQARDARLHNDPQAAAGFCTPNL